ncbi:Glutathione S-transferase family protein [Klebsormidium nitens]|uniref:Glutathione S-transferase family protein n=1 Tax=Klebsormidium nitens TaxID=105231 RepID=A0A1Y1HHY6_KLENI|nr:Glutathione S-transferase family protein [Klebsormidium nitens]|eukprot:GAQ78065.1 Glutathione S-transferase family protein [Klebsormidium nitens]
MAASMALTKPLLYFFPPSYATMKARVLMEEKGIEYDLELVHTFLCENLQRSYVQKVNPKGTVPALALPNGTILTESLEIMKWADNHDNAPLGGSSVDRTKVDFWLDAMDKFDGNYFIWALCPPPLGPILHDQLIFKKAFVEQHAKFVAELAQFYTEKANWTAQEIEKLKDEDAKNSIKDEVRRLVQTAEKQLASTEFVAGEAVSAADAMFATLLNRVEMAQLGPELLADAPKVQEYWEKFKARKSYLASVPASL